MQDKQPPPAILAQLGQTIPSLSGAAGWKVLRGGMVNQLWRQADVVLKVYDLAGASPLFPNDPLAEATALHHVWPLDLGPQLLAQGAGWLAYRHAKGTTGLGDPAAVARLLGRVHGLSLPHLPIRREEWPHPLSLIHGDPVPGNILWRRQNNPLLIDWQCPALGDAAHDLAIFLSPAMQQLYAGRILSHDERHLFLESYPNRETVARYHRHAAQLHGRIVEHCLWRAARNGAGYAHAAQIEQQFLQQCSDPDPTPQHATGQNQPEQPFLR